MIKGQNPNDQQLLEGLLGAEASAVEKIYDLALPSVIQWVSANSGSESDARDIFQEAILALFRKVEGGDLVLTCTLKSFLRIMCRNLWLTRLRDQKKYEASDLEDVEMVSLDQDMLTRLEQSEKEQLFFKHFDLLGDDCQQILKWFFEKLPLKRIAERLDTSENYIKKRKFICKEKLVKAVQADSSFTELCCQLLVVGCWFP